MSAKAFVDTNVLVYVFDGRVVAKQRRAAQLLEQLADAEEPPVLSTQVLQETFVALTRKLAMNAKEALATLHALGDTNFTIQTVGAPIIWRAVERLIKDKLSFWDALVIETALETECTVLYSEDMQDGRSFDGLRVVNPFG
jgi:predicted nucleic acid-binding protein